MSFANLISVVPANACETVSGQYVDVVSPDPKTISVSDIAWALSRQARFAGHTISDQVWSVAQHCLFVTDLVELGFASLNGSDDSGSGLGESLHAWLARKNFVDSWYITDGQPTLDSWYITDGRPTINAIYSEARATLQEDGMRTIMGALMHDATEAYLIDLPSPVKRHQALREPYKELENGLKVVIDQALNLQPMSHLEEEIVVWADLLALQIEAGMLMPSRGRGWNGDRPQMKITDLSLFPSRIFGWQEAYKEFMRRYRKIAEDGNYKLCAV